MPEALTLDLVDRDGAIREALDASAQPTRAQFLRRAVTGGGALLAGGLLIGGLPAVAAGQEPSAAQDAEILNFALLLEFLESEFYVQAVASGALSGAALSFATTVRDHELAHVAFLQQALGSAAGAKPAFDFGNTIADQSAFLATAVVLEDTGVAAYDGQGPNLTRRALAAAAQIVSVEARHAAWVRRIVAGPRYPNRPADLPAPAAVEPSLTREQVEQAVAQTGFITG